MDHTCVIQRLVGSRTHVGTYHYYIAQDEDDAVVLTLDMPRLAYLDSYDTAILIADDDALAVAVKWLKEMGRKVEVVYFPSAQDFALLRSCDLNVLVTRAILRNCSTVS